MEPAKYGAAVNGSRAPEVYTPGATDTAQPVLTP